MATDESELPAASADEPVDFVNREPVPLAPLAPTSQVRWKLGLILLVFSAFGSAAILPFSISVMRQAPGGVITSAMVPFIAVFTLLIEGTMSAAAIAIGIGLGRRTGLGPFLLDGIDGPPDAHSILGKAKSLGPNLVDDIDGAPGSGEAASDGPSGRSRRRARKAIGLAAAMGVVLGAVVIGCSYAFDAWMPKMATKFEQPPLLEGLLGSIGAAIREEIWLRLGFMTLLAWLGTVVARCKPGNPAVIWSANVVAALAFGAIHLPQAAMLFGLNAALIAFVLIGNGLPGIVFGWLFWRKGLIAAMVSHFMLDVVLKVVYPAVAG